MIDLSIAKQFIESLYIDTCNVYEFQHVADPETGITSQQEVLVHKDVPCKLSYMTQKQAGDGVGSSLILSVKLFLSLDLDIKPGSKIDVTKSGKTVSYKNSGMPARYINHQEIILDNWQGWA